MMKKPLARLVCLLTALMLLFSIAADAAGSFVSDQAALLTEGEITALNERASMVLDRYGIAVMIATVDSLYGKDLVDSADLLLESSGVQNGILLLLAMEDRDYAISTMGSDAIWYFNDDNIRRIEDGFLPYLYDNEYAEGFEAFVTLCGDTIVYENEQYGPKDPVYFSVPRLIVCLALGLLLAGIPLIRHKNAIRNVAKKTEAADYVRRDSMQITSSSDIFLYRHVNRIKRSDNDSSRGGSSTHTSSSGVTHGGSHGKF